MTRDEKIAEACRLREAGVSTSKISGVLGVHKKTVLRWTVPDLAERDRAVARAWKAGHKTEVRAYDAAYGREREHRGTCTSCSGPMGAGVIYDGVCSACAEAAKHKRCMTVVKWWSEGVSGPEICRRLGWSRGYLSVEMYRMREAGYDLPYRNRGYSKHAKVVAP